MADILDSILEEALEKTPSDWPTIQAIFFVALGSESDDCVRHIAHRIPERSKYKNPAWLKQFRLSPSQVDELIADYFLRFFSGRRQLKKGSKVGYIVKFFQKCLLGKNFGDHRARSADALDHLDPATEAESGDAISDNGNYQVDPQESSRYPNIEDIASSLVTSHSAHTKALKFLLNHPQLGLALGLSESGLSWGEIANKLEVNVDTLTKRRREWGLLNQERTLNFDDFLVSDIGRWMNGFFPLDRDHLRELAALKRILSIQALLLYGTDDSNHQM